MTPFSIFNPHPSVAGENQTYPISNVRRSFHSSISSVFLSLRFLSRFISSCHPSTAPPAAQYIQPLPNYHTCTSNEARHLLPLFRRSLPHSGLLCEEYDFRSLVSFGFFIFKASRTATQFHSLSRASHSKSRFITGFIFVYQEARCHQMRNSL